jgi:hypothetical protein
MTDLPLIGDDAVSASSRIAPHQSDFGELVLESQKMQRRMGLMQSDIKRIGRLVWASFASRVFRRLWTGLSYDHLVTFTEKLGELSRGDHSLGCFCLMGQAGSRLTINAGLPRGIRNKRVAEIYERLSVDVHECWGIS